jgi:hypothetical protein
LVSAQDKEVNGASTDVRTYISDQAIECPAGTDDPKTGMNGDFLKMATTSLTGQCHGILRTMEIEGLHPDDLTMGILAKHYHTMKASLHGHRQEPSIEGKALQVLHRTGRTEDRLEMNNRLETGDFLETNDRPGMTNNVLPVAATSTHTSPHIQLHNLTKDAHPGGTGTANNHQGDTTENAIATERGNEGETRMIALPF